MKNLSRITASLGIVASVLVGSSALVAGCGGDDTVGGNGEPDATADAARDAVSDHTVIDTGNDVQTDSPSPDANEAAVPDAGPDAADAHDAADSADSADAQDSADAADSADSADAHDSADAADAADSADANDASDAPLGQPVTDFINQATATLCATVDTCCTDAGVPGTFDAGACTATYGPTSGAGGYGNINLAAPAASRGLITVNAVKAQACLDDLKAYSCTQRASAWYIKVNDDCAAALQGTVAPGGACANAFECSGNQNCANGTCVAVGVAGAACTSNLNIECVTHGFDSAQALWCNKGTGVCEATRALGAACPQQITCASALCNGTSCTDQFNFPASVACGGFFK